MLEHIQQQLQSHFEDPYHCGECEITTHAAESQVAHADCQLRFEVSVSDTGKVTEIWWQGQGCWRCEGLASWIAMVGEMRDVDECSRQAMVEAIGEQLARSCVADAGETESGTGAQDESALNKLLSSETEQPCMAQALDTFCVALTQSVLDTDGDLTDGTQFGGPSLREEC